MYQNAVNRVKNFGDFYIPFYFLSLKIHHMIQDIRYVKGINGLCNKIIHQAYPGSLKNVIYFGGDVQNFERYMLDHRDNVRYNCWSLEKTVDILATKFTNHNIYIIVAASYYLKTFAVFSNFFNSDKYGVPCLEPTLDGLLHLIFLLHNFSTSPKFDFKLIEGKGDSSKTVKECDTDGKRTSFLQESCEALLNSTIFQQEWTLVGFSKGCAVLNQFIYSFSTLTLPPPVENNDLSTDWVTLLASKFLHSIDAIYWLDGGHSGGKNTWVTDKNILEKFALNIRASQIDRAERKARMEVHVTPYQIACATRPWIGKEEKQFTRYLDIYLKRPLENFDNLPTISFTRKVHGENDRPCFLENHFELLKEF